MFIIIVFGLGIYWPPRLLFFMTALLLSILAPLFLLFSSISLSYLNIAARMRECLGKHSCMSSSFPIAILNGTCFFCEAKWYLLWSMLRPSKSNQTNQLMLYSMLIVVDYHYLILKSNCI